MKTVNERINFKSHFPVLGFDRIKRVDHYGHYAQSNSTFKTFEMPFWQELQRNNRVSKTEVFTNKF